MVAPAPLAAPREPVDVGHDVAGLRRLAGLTLLEEKILHVDDEEGGARRLDAFEKVLLATCDGHALDDFGGDV
jgi:hypothetical protein